MEPPFSLTNFSNFLIEVFLKNNKNDKKENKTYIKDLDLKEQECLLNNNSLINRMFGHEHKSELMYKVIDSSIFKNENIVNKSESDLMYKVIDEYKRVIVK